VDRQGIAHNSMHLVYFGVGMNEYFRGLGFDRFAADAENGTAMHVVQATVSYKAPILLDEEIDIACRVAKLGRSSLTFVYEVFRAGSDLVLASGDQVWVNTHRASHSSTAWPEAFRTVLRAREPGLIES